MSWYRGGPLAFCCSGGTICRARRQLWAQHAEEFYVYWNWLEMDSLGHRVGVLTVSNSNEETGMTEEVRLCIIGDFRLSIAPWLIVLDF